MSVGINEGNRFTRAVALVVVLYFLTRHEIVKSFRGNDSERPKGPPGNYGGMDRKVW